MTKAALLFPTDACPNCSHEMGMHESDGCLINWEYSPHGGPALREGCPCNLTIHNYP